MLIPFSGLRGGVSLAATLDKAVGMKVNFYSAHHQRMSLGKTDWGIDQV